MLATKYNTAPVLSTYSKLYLQMEAAKDSSPFRGDLRRWQCVYMSLHGHFSQHCTLITGLLAVSSVSLPSPLKTSSLASSQSKYLPAFRSLRRKWNSTQGLEEKESWSEEEELFPGAGKNRAPAVGVI